MSISKPERYAINVSTAAWSFFSHVNITASKPTSAKKMYTNKTNKLVLWSFL